MTQKLEKMKIVTFGSVIACIILSASLIGFYLNFTELLQQQNDRLESMQEEISNLAQIFEDELQEFRREVNSTLSAFNDTLTNFKDQYYFP